MGWASTYYGKQIWTDVVILTLKVSTSNSQHMGSIWETNGKHTLYGQYPQQHKQISPFPCWCSTAFPCWCSTLKLRQAFTNFVLKVFLLSKKRKADWIMEKTKSWLVSVLQPLPLPSTWRWKREVAVSLPKSCAVTKRRWYMNKLHSENQLHAVVDNRPHRHGL